MNRSVLLLVGFTLGCESTVTVAEIPVAEGVDNAIVGIETQVAATVRAGQAIVADCKKVDTEGQLWDIEDDGVPLEVEILPPDAVLRDGGAVLAARAGRLSVRCLAPGSNLPPGTPRTVDVVPGIPVRTLARLSSETNTAVAGENFEVACLAEDRFGNDITDLEFDVMDGTSLAGSRAAEGEPFLRSIQLTRAGDHAIRCVVASAVDAEPASIQVVSGPPQTVRLAGPGFGGAPAARIEATTTFVPVVLDAFGNQVDGVSVQIGDVTPAGAAQVIGDLNLVPLQPGAVRIGLIVEAAARAWPGFERITTVIDTLVGPPAGVPQCLDPPDASMIVQGDGAPYRFVGRVLEAGPDSRAFIDDREVTIDPADGRIEADIEVRRGLNLVEIRVESNDAVDARRLCAFQASTDWLAPTGAGVPDRLPEGVTSGTHEAALDDADPTDIDSLIDVIRAAANSDRLRDDVDAALASLIPTGAASCPSLGALDVCNTRLVFSYGAGQTDRVNRLQIADVTNLAVGLEPPTNSGAYGRVVIDLGLPQIRVKAGVALETLTLGQVVSNEVLELWGEWDGFDARIELSVGSSQGLPDVVLDDLVFTRVGNLALDVGTLLQAYRFTVDQFFFDLVQPVLLAELRRQLLPLAANALENVVLSGRTELASALDAGVTFEGLSGQEFSLSGGVEFDRVDVDADAIVVATGIRPVFSPDPDVGPTGTDRGVLLATALGPSFPGQRAMQPLAATTRLGVLNQTFDAMWRLGLFEFQTSTRGLPQTVPDLPFEGSLDVGLALAPVVLPGLDEDGRIRMMFGPLDVFAVVDVNMDVGASLRWAVEVSVEPRTEDGSLVLEAARIDRTWFSVQGLPLSTAGAEAALEEGVTELGSTLLEGLLGDVWTAPPFPTVGPPDDLVGYGVDTDDRFGLRSPELTVTDRLDVRGAVELLPAD